MLPNNYGGSNFRRGSWLPSLLKDWGSLEDVFSDWPTSLKEIGKTFAIDLVEGAESYRAMVNLPGIKKEDINIKLEDNILTFEVQQSQETEEKNEGYLHRERFFGSASRSIRLPQACDPDGVHAGFKDGVLTVEIAKLPEKQAKSIQIK